MTSVKLSSLIEIDTTVAKKVKGYYALSDLYNESVYLKNYSNSLNHLSIILDIYAYIIKISEIHLYFHKLLYHTCSKVCVGKMFYNAIFKYSKSSQLLDKFYVDG